MEITTQIHKGVLIVRFSGEFDMHTADQFKETVDACLHESGLKDILIHWENVSFIDSSGIGVLLGRYKKVTHAGGKIVLVGLQEPVKKILELSGMLDIMKSYADENEALQCF